MRAALLMVSGEAWNSLLKFDVRRGIDQDHWPTAFSHKKCLPVEATFRGCTKFFRILGVASRACTVQNSIPRACPL
jgi:hypothetical protein